MRKSNSSFPKETAAQIGAAHYSCESRAQKPELLLCPCLWPVEISTPVVGQPPVSVCPSVHLSVTHSVSQRMPANTFQASPSFSLLQPEAHYATYVLSRAPTQVLKNSQTNITVILKQMSTNSQQLV